MQISPFLRQAAWSARAAPALRRLPQLSAVNRGNAPMGGGLQWRTPSRMYSSETADPVAPPKFLTEGELRVFNKLKDGLQPTRLEVQDVSGGCGSMYALDIVSEQFKGLPVIKQHRLVNKVLGDEMKAWHGVQMKTTAPS